jgi:hypothetical protein
MSRQPQKMVCPESGASGSSAAMATCRDAIYHSASPSLLNCYQDYAPRNATELAELLRGEASCHPTPSGRQKHSARSDH